MYIIVNGEKVDIGAGKTLLDWVLEQQGILDTSIIEYNGVIMAQQEWPKILLQEDDKLEIFKFVGGG